jgi:large subunit ribosomal protein L35
MPPPRPYLERWPYEFVSLILQADVSFVRIRPMPAFSIGVGFRKLSCLPTTVSSLESGFVMPKMKTHKGTKKRFKLSANGKAMHRQAGTSHLASRMSQKRKRKLRGTAPVDSCMEPSIHQALGKYGYK